MGKIIFVGVHNKPGFKPLDSKSKSGILINRCIRALRPKECIKTNLFDVDYLPNAIEWESLVMDWHNRIQSNGDDVIILLGSVTQRAWIESTYNLRRNTINVGHPSAVWSNEKKEWYVKNIVEKVRKSLINLNLNNNEQNI